MKITNNIIREWIEEEYKLRLEGRGMSFRTTNDVFQSKDGTQYRFEKTIQLPQSEPQFKNANETQSAVNDALEQEGISIGETINKPNKAAMIVILAPEEKGERVAFVRYFLTMTPDGKGKWPEKKFSIETGFKKTGGTTTSTMEALPIKPSDLVGDDSLHGYRSLARTIGKNAKRLVQDGSMPNEVYFHIAQLLKAALQNEESPLLKGGKKYAAAYDKYLGEILAPISLQTGWLATGQREESEKAILAPLGKSYSDDFRIAFNIAANAEMIDSSLVDNDSGLSIGISSKAGSGAAASIGVFKNLLENMKKNNPAGAKKFAAKNKTFLNVVEAISSKSWFDGPVFLAKEYGLISSADERILDKLKVNPNMNLQQFATQVKLTKNLIKLTAALGGEAPPRTKLAATKGYQPVYHVISGVAKVVARKINEDPAFEQAIRELLAASSVIQISSKMSIKGDDCMFTEFVVKYPPSFKGRVKIDASKNYSTTRIRGRLSFKLK